MVSKKFNHGWERREYPREYAILGEKEWMLDEG
jgi:hypothetical protein